MSDLGNVVADYRERNAEHSAYEHGLRRRARAVGALAQAAAPVIVLPIFSGETVRECLEHLAAGAGLDAGYLDMPMAAFYRALTTRQT